MKINKKFHELRRIHNVVETIEKDIIIRGRLLQVEDSFKIDMKGIETLISNRNFAPQVTNKRNIEETGVNLIGVKGALVKIGYSVDDVTDALDIINIPDEFYIIHNGKKTKFIKRDFLNNIIKNVLNLLSSSTTTKEIQSEQAKYIIYRMIHAKAVYIKKATIIKGVKDKKEALKIVEKYNVNNGIFYGMQQRLIAGEISELFEKSLSFSECVKDLKLKYTWQQEQPFNGTMGQSWRTCKIEM